MFQEDFPGYRVKGFERVVLGLGRSVRVWVRDVSGFRGKEVEMSTRNAQKMVADGKSERVYLKSTW